MEAMDFNVRKRLMGGAILENPTPLHAMLGWLSADNDPPTEEKCNFDTL